jgi:hypothetical protein
VALHLVGDAWQQPWRVVVSGETQCWWVYVPAQYDPATPAALLVAQDANLSGAE